MSALEMQGFRKGRSQLGSIDFWDVVYFLIGLVVFGLAVADRFNAIPFSLSSVI
jgi:energy-coupling factor transport system permease protein